DHTDGGRELEAEPVAGDELATEQIADHEAGRKCGRQVDEEGIPAVFHSGLPVWSIRSIKSSPVPSISTSRSSCPFSSSVPVRFFAPRRRKSSAPARVMTRGVG